MIFKGLREGGAASWKGINPRPHPIMSIGLTESRVTRCEQWAKDRINPEEGRENDED